MPTTYCALTCASAPCLDSLRFFEPTLLPGATALALDGPVSSISVGAYHLGLLTESGRAYTFGTGTPLGVPHTARKSWELVEVTAHAPDLGMGGGGLVRQMICGPYTTAMIVAD